MAYDLKYYQSQIDRLEGEREQNAKQVKRLEKEKTKAEYRLSNAQRALTIIQEVAKQTQEQLEYRISELATLAMESVLEEPYNVRLEFTTKGNNTQANIVFERDGIVVDPIAASGGGAVDIAALALQITLWSVSSPRPRNVMVLDEPLKWLKGNEMPIKGATMLHEIAHKIGIQILMVSHSVELIEGADNVFKITDYATGNNRSNTDDVAGTPRPVRRKRKKKK